MARIPFPLATFVAAAMFAGSGTLLGISLTQPDPGTQAANAAACSAGQSAGRAFCWTEEPAVVDDSGVTAKTIDYHGHRSGGTRAAEIAWISLTVFPDTTPGPDIPLAPADLSGLEVHKGDKVTARIVQGDIISIASAKTRVGVMGASPGVYPLVFLALFFLVAGSVAAAFSRDRRLTGFRRAFTRVADRVLIPLLGMAAVIFFIHRSPATLAGLVLLAAAAAAGLMTGASYRRTPAKELSRPTVRTRTAPPRQP